MGCYRSLCVVQVEINIKINVKRLKSVYFVLRANNGSIEKIIFKHGIFEIIKRRPPTPRQVDKISKTFRI